VLYATTIPTSECGRYQTVRVGGVASSALDHPKRNCQSQQQFKVGGGRWFFHWVWPGGGKEWDSH